MSEIIDLGNIDAIDEMTSEEIEEIINDTKKTLNEYLNQRSEEHRLNSSH